MILSKTISLTSQIRVTAKIEIRIKLFQFYNLLVFVSNISASRSQQKRRREGQIQERNDRKWLQAAPMTLINVINVKQGRKVMRVPYFCGSQWP